MVLQLKVLLVVDGNFTLGAQSQNDQRFTVSWLKSALQSFDPTQVQVTLDTANRNGARDSDAVDPDAVIEGAFNFATSEVTLSDYTEIWMMGTSCAEFDHDITPPSTRANSDNPPNAQPLTEDELLAIAQFMQNGGGVLAVGDHDSLGCYMCARIPRVRTMRRWFAADDTSPFASEWRQGAPDNWPFTGTSRADTLQMDVNQAYHFSCQSDDIPQPLTLLPVDDQPNHPLFDIMSGSTSKVLQVFPDHMHEGEALGFGGVAGSEPWVMDAVLSFDGQQFTEYPTVNGNQERPAVIAQGTVVPHRTFGATGSSNCRSGDPFVGDEEEATAKMINTISVYDGRKAGVGRVYTDSSFHHMIDLNLIGDPCADAMVQCQTGLVDYQGDMAAFYRNVVLWLANEKDLSHLSNQTRQALAGGQVRGVKGQRLPPQ